MTTNPCAAQKSASGPYPSSDEPEPCEKTITGSSFPLSGADTLTRRSSPRPDADSFSGFTETTRLGALKATTSVVAVPDWVMRSSFVLCRDGVTGFDAAASVFVAKGVEAPLRDIAAKA